MHLSPPWQFTQGFWSKNHLSLPNVLPVPPCTVCPCVCFSRRPFRAFTVLSGSQLSFQTFSLYTSLHFSWYVLLPPPIILEPFISFHSLPSYHFSLLLLIGRTRVVVGGVEESEDPVSSFFNAVSFYSSFLPPTTFGRSRNSKLRWLHLPQCASLYRVQRRPTLGGCEFFFINVPHGASVINITVPLALSPCTSHLIKNVRGNCRILVVARVLENCEDGSDK